MARPELDNLPPVAKEAALAFNMQILKMTDGPQIAAGTQAALQTPVTMHETVHSGAATTGQGHAAGKSGSLKV